MSSIQSPDSVQFEPFDTEFWLSVILDGNSREIIGFCITEHKDQHSNSLLTNLPHRVVQEIGALSDKNALEEFLKRRGLEENTHPTYLSSTSVTIPLNEDDKNPALGGWKRDNTTNLTGREPRLSSRLDDTSDASAPVSPLGLL